MRGVEYLVDTSAYVRLMRDHDDRDHWRAQSRAGRLTVCPLNELEILFSARSVDHRERIIKVLRESFRWVVMPDRIFARAAEVQDEMTSRGCHRAAGAVDLLVAATAEEHGMTVLHYDSGFDSIAEITGQRVKWLARPGSLC